MIPQGTTKSVDYGSIIQLHIIFVMIGSAYVLQYFISFPLGKLGELDSSKFKMDTSILEVYGVNINIYQYIYLFTFT